MQYIIHSGTRYFVQTRTPQLVGWTNIDWLPSLEDAQKYVRDGRVKKRYPNSVGHRIVKVTATEEVVG